MAAPKKWGYTRDQPFGPEMLVSWSDGDLTEILVREVTERLLRHADERRTVAAWARAAHDTSAAQGKDWIETPRAGLIERCKQIAHD